MKNFLKMDCAFTAKKTPFNFFLSIFTFLLVLGMASCGDGNEPSNVTFDIQIEGVGVRHAKVTYTPSNQEVWYFCMCEKKDDLFPNGEDINNIKTVLNQNFAGMKKNIEQGMHMSFEEYLNSMKVNEEQVAYKQGTFVREENLLDPETEYIAYACIINGNAQVVSEVAYKTFTTDPDSE